MEVYLVGGAVRDKLMGLIIKDKDWVVVGANPNELIALGYCQVGKDFPVFLHPQTKEEYALARTEKKSGTGYQGFKFCVDTNISLEDDLLRRDLTINAIAEDQNSNIVDPYHGQQDIKDKTLRHVSGAFIEDPVRLLRLARFAARFADFSIHKDTQKLIIKMVQSGEIDNLVAERVWSEMVKALQSDAPWVFFDVIKSCGANKILWPDFFAENYTAILARLVKVSSCPHTRFAAIVAGYTKSEILNFANKYRIPKDALSLALIVSRSYKKCLALSAKSSATDVLDILNSIDAWRQPGRINAFMDAVFSQVSLSSNIARNIITDSYQIAAKVKAAEVITPDLTGKDIGLAITQKRLALIESRLSSK
jgi:tRNA nucleotidyltransferase (CCA-adding enzyme)